MSVAVPACPNCQSSDVVKNGHTRHGKQNYKCRDCRRQFVENPQWRMISEETKGIIDRLLLEKLPLAGIARALQISELWVQQYVNQKYKQVEQEVQVRPKPKRRLTVQMDELWSFVDSKGEQQYVIMGCYGIGPSRVMGTIVELHHDDNGIIWPENVAPFQVHLIALAGKDENVAQQANDLYADLQKQGIEVLFDDRDASAGEKLADADLIVDSLEKVQINKLEKLLNLE